MSRLVFGTAVLFLLDDLATSQALSVGLEMAASDGQSADSFGRSVSISGHTAVVGAPFAQEFGFNSGSAYVFVRTAEGWCEQAKLLRPDGAVGDAFGSVSMSGDTVVVGAPGNVNAGIRSGSVYVFVRTGSSWHLQAKLTASDAEPNVGFGHAVAISHDTVVVGALASVYVFVRTGASWSEQARLVGRDVSTGDHYGDSVAVFGDTAVVGAPRDDVAFEDSGSAYVFSRTGTSWNQQAKLNAADAWASAKFGLSVSVSGDTAVVGGAQSAGGAYVYVRSGADWAEQAKLTASDAMYGANFGRSVFISGDRVVVGAPGDGVHGAASGSAYLFERSGAIWRQKAKLTPSYGGHFDAVGISVSISDGPPLVGAPSFGANNAGTAFAFSLVDYATFCSPAQNNSTGAPAFVTVSGSPMLADDYLNFEITGLPPWQIAYFLMSQNQASTPVGNGILCLGAEQHRFVPFHFSGASGSVSFSPNLSGNLPPTLGAVHSGETWNWQMWYRDTGSTSNFTDALEITLR